MVIDDLMRLNTISIALIQASGDRTLITNFYLTNDTKCLTFVLTSIDKNVNHLLLFMFFSM